MPCLQGRSGYLKLFGSLALGDTLRLEVEVLPKQVGPLESVPELMAVDIVAVWKIDDSAHRYLALQAIV